MAPETALINGLAGGALSASDRGLNYGDGVFETMAVCGGEVLCWRAHMDRMRRGCAALQFSAPSEKEISTEADRLLAGADRGVLKLVVTRGAGGRGYAPPADPMPTRILSFHPWPAHPPDCRHDGVDAAFCATRLSIQPRLAGIKHLNRLEQVMARQELAASGHLEGIMMDMEGNVVEATGSNLFIVRDGALVTPVLDRCGVAGIVRGEIIERAPDWGVAVTIRRLLPADLVSADEAFLTNSIIGVWPLRRIGDAALSPGPVSRRIAALLTGAHVLAPA